MAGLQYWSRLRNSKELESSGVYGQAAFGFVRVRSELKKSEIQSSQPFQVYESGPVLPMDKK